MAPENDYHWALMGCMLPQGRVCCGADGHLKLGQSLMELAVSLLIIFATVGQQVFLRREIWMTHLCFCLIGHYLENQPRLRDQVEGMNVYNQKTQRIRRLGSKG